MAANWRAKQYLWRQLESAGIPVDSSQAKSWEQSYGQSTPVVFLNALDQLVHERKLTGLDLELIATIAVTAFKMGNVHDGRLID